MSTPLQRMDQRRIREHGARDRRERERAVCASALDLYRAEHAEPGAVSTIRVQSQTDPKLEYTLHFANGIVECNCRGFLSHKHCKHAEAVARLLQEELT